MLRRDIVPSTRDRSKDRLAHARDRLEQLALAVTRNTGDADDLARVNGERSVRNAQHTAVNR